MDLPEAYRNLLDSHEDGLYFVDPDRRILYWNEAAEKISGFRADAVLGQCCFSQILMHTSEDGRQLCGEACPVFECLQDGQERRARVFLHHQEGHRVPVLVFVTPVRDERGEIVGVAESFSLDAPSSPLLDCLGEAERAALLDPVTALPNQPTMRKTLHAALSRLSPEAPAFGVVLTAIDRFKPREQGQDPIGEQTLRMVGRTLAGGVSGRDTVGRWEDEKFLTVTAPIDETLLAKLASSFGALVASCVLAVGPHEIRVTVSTVALLAKHGDTTDGLLDRALALLEESRRQGDNRVTIEA